VDWEETGGQPDAARGKEEEEVKQVRRKCEESVKLGNLGKRVLCICEVKWSWKDILPKVCIQYAYCIYFIIYNIYNYNIYKYLYLYYA
jgi:hypothetical protein